MVRSIDMNILSQTFTIENWSGEKAQEDRNTRGREHNAQIGENNMDQIIASDIQFNFFTIKTLHQKHQ